MNFAKKTIPVIAVVIIYYTFKWLIDGFSFVDSFDLPEHVLEKSSWVYAVEHHTIQLFLGLLAIGIFSRGRFKDWGMNLN
ncbi:MAG TPA: hypothetical protein VFM80_10855, partial [Gracilimonas sp.]|uniref:hypothetical protein n=1 Tax=Gracilimonas sp. TaxID=1974203 RepID=UPI002D834B9A|nr:hypothetical protein [Gracilimonas sp.]